jgi:hypothetical protein
MPQLDVSFMTMDPMFSDLFTVIRRDEVLVNGRAATRETHYPDTVGVVTYEPVSFERREDGQMAPRTIFVATKFQMRGIGPGVQPDLIVHNGTTYQVNQINPYSRFGQGFYEVTASSNTAVDPVTG